MKRKTYTKKNILYMQCTQCMVVKSKDMFSLAPNGLYGRKSKCKMCTRKNDLILRDKKLFGGKREIVIKRDKEKCLQCGITRKQHKKKFGIDITVNHIDGNGIYKKEQNNKLSNLETLCSSCHSTKDNIRKNKEKKQCSLGGFCLSPCTIWDDPVGHEIQHVDGYNSACSAQKAKHQELLSNIKQL